MIQIFDDGQVLRIVNGSETFNWSKDLLSVSYDSKINLFSGGSLVLQITDYTEVSTPVATSKADLGAKISKMINEAGAYDGRKMLVGNVREKFKDEFLTLIRPKTGRWYKPAQAWWSAWPVWPMVHVT